MSNKLQLRRDTAANWETANPVLAQGEIGLILDSNGKVVGQKIGDGVTEWKELPYDIATQLAEEVRPISAAVEKLEWRDWYKFNGVSSVANLKEPIILSKDGDSIEVFVRDVHNETAQSFLYGFSYAGTSSAKWHGIGVSNTKVVVRADDNTWIGSSDGAKTTLLESFKISYEDGNTLIYLNGELKITHSGQSTLTLHKFGQGLSDYWWRGSIDKILVNGTEYSLGESAELVDVSLESETSFLSKEEQELFYSGSLSDMYVSKTEKEMCIYLRHHGSVFVKYPFKYRYQAFIEDIYPAYFDNWGIGKVGISRYTPNGMIDEAYLFYSSEAEMTLLTTSGAEVGGAMHGFDNIIVDADGNRSFAIIIDNQRVEETAILPLTSARKIEVYQTSELCESHTNTEPLGTILKNWNWEDGKLRLTASFTALRAFSLDHIYSSLLGVYRHWQGDAQDGYMTSKAIKNNVPYKIYDMSDGWSNSDLSNADDKCTRIIAYGDKGYGVAMEVLETTDKSGRGMFVVTNGNPYNKIYNRLCKDIEVEPGDELSATTEWTIL